MNMSLIGKTVAPTTMGKKTVQENKSKKRQAINKFVSEQKSIKSIDIENIEYTNNPFESILRGLVTSLPQ